ncbi:hypothetical protein pETSU_249 [Edwardsiella phage pEt-SU]|uniref:DUF3592 domain-containing protein n=1 Tax=Edwardsiella phage pEt-SU TaxID=2562142 RepID=A0A4D6DWW5_9CAUD|nr:hypothetical protein HOV39_gp273 [Edwardsiella phage pEt-SU]QBZ70830.1 hypothetical protein pETSU_249 [Edwardsiella phage pEt-SU]
MVYRRLFLVFMALCLWYSVYALVSVNKYMTSVDTPVEVKQLYSGTSTGKYSKMEFIAIYQTRDGTIFDRRISASTFYQLKPGDKIMLSIRPFDIRQNWVDNAIWFFGVITYSVIASGVGGIFVVLAFWRSKRRKK